MEIQNSVLKIVAVIMALVLSWEALVKEGFPILFFFYCSVVLKSLQSLLTGQITASWAKRNSPSLEYMYTDTGGLEICCG